jgi:hypothetical protein
VKNRDLNGARILGKQLLEIETREAGHPESASGGEEIELTFEGGGTLLVFVHESGELVVETD